MNNKDLSKGYTLTLDWASNYLSWKNQKNINTIFVKFEDLVFEQEKTFKYILSKLKEFINFEIDNKKKLSPKPTYELITFLPSGDQPIQ